MNFNLWKTREYNQRALYFAAFTLLLLATIFLSGCADQGNVNNQGVTNARTGAQSNTNQGNTNTNPVNKNNRDFGDTPIVVTGGSVHLDIGKDGNSSGNYNCKTCSFKQITILDNDAEDAEDPPPTQLAQNLDWKIVLTLKSGATVTLTSLHDGTGVTATFPEQKSGEQAKVHKFKWRQYLGFIKRKDQVTAIDIQSKDPTGTSWSTPAGLPSLPSSKKFSMLLEFK